MYRVVYTIRSRNESLKTFAWLAERSVDAAAAWFDRLENAIAELAEDPVRNPVAEDESEILGMTLRQATFGPRRSTYRILYCIEGETVTLHSIRHSARGAFGVDEA